MARYEHLPIYKAAFDLLVFLEGLVRNFPRYHKYTHGADLRNTAREVLKLIIRANNSEEKLPILRELRERVEELKLLVRICKEVRAFPNFKAFEHSVEMVVDISRQNEGWLRSMEKRGAGRSPRIHPAQGR